jgi:broad-specificity NMP kinase
MIKDGGFSQYIRVDTSKELVEKVSQEVNDVVKGLKNVNIGDIQWIHFLEKILKLANQFPAEFEALKNAALK